MGKLKSFALAGLEMWFWSNDHEPPHFHIRQKGQWEYRVYFLEPEKAFLEMVVGRRRMPRQKRKQLAALVRKHRASLLKEWEMNHP